ncbi:hypothetical protein [Hyphomicrobium sp. 99]|uniref:hypothetical protein n=1 Tax=Hyphomicrobium sp. 99 TaxID=1163419 RepID=UPI0005F884EA|nr:hypothetical protein [Hyphomicrobium sp. 99]
MNDSNQEGKGLPRAGVAVPEILTTVSDEVRMLSDTASDLQDLIGNLVVAGAFGGSQSLYQLQSLDRLCQNLGAVADFLASIANGSSPDWKVDVTDAARAVKLADVCDRLTGRKATTDPSEETSGEFDDFETWPMTG